MQARTQEQQAILDRLRTALCMLDGQGHKVMFNALDDTAPNRIEPPLIVAGDAPFVIHCATADMAKDMAQLFTKVTGVRDFARADTETPDNAMVYIRTRDINEGVLGKIEASWEAEMYREAKEAALQQPRQRQWGERARRNDGRTGMLAL